MLELLAIWPFLSKIKTELYQITIEMFFFPFGICQNWNWPLPWVLEQSPCVYLCSMKIRRIVRTAQLKCIAIQFSYPSPSSIFALHTVARLSSVAPYALKWTVEWLSGELALTAHFINSIVHLWMNISFHWRRAIDLCFFKILILWLEIRIRALMKC